MNEVVRPSGIIIPGMDGELRAWIKPRGEPAIILIETPAEVYDKITAALESGAPHVLLHEWAFGQPMWIPRAWLLDTNISVTYKNKGQTRSGGVWAGNCPCPEHAAERGEEPDGVPT